MSGDYIIYFYPTRAAEPSCSPRHFGDSRKTDNKLINHWSNREERGRDSPGSFWVTGSEPSVHGASTSPSRPSLSSLSDS